MKNTTLALFSLCLALSAQAEIRTWKDATGTHEIKAELVGVKAGKVTLKRENGTTITLPVASLSKEDQALLGEASGGGSAAAGEWPQWRQRSQARLGERRCRPRLLRLRRLRW
jgi:hypothetical protein